MGVDDAANHDTHQTANEEDVYEKAPTPLHAAMKLADLIRQQIGLPSSETNPHEQTTSDDSSFFRNAESSLPGLVDGVVAGCLTAALLTPVRQQILCAAGNHMGMLPDLIVTSSQVVSSAMAALYVGSLHGSRVYLQQLAQVPTNADSPVADGICNNVLVQRLLNDYNSSQEEERTVVSRDGGSGGGGFIASLDPRHRTLQTFYAALSTCRERHAIQQLQHHQQQQSNDGLDDSTSTVDMDSGTYRWWR